MIEQLGRMKRRELPLVFVNGHRCSGARFHYDQTKHEVSIICVLSNGQDAEQVWQALCLGELWVDVTKVRSRLRSLWNKLKGERT